VAIGSVWYLATIHKLIKLNNMKLKPTSNLLFSDYISRPRINYKLLALVMEAKQKIEGFEHTNLLFKNKS